MIVASLFTYSIFVNTNSVL